MSFDFEKFRGVDIGIIDNREEASGLFKRLDILGIRYKRDNLEIGDWTPSRDNVIEIKRVKGSSNDIRSSVMDGRYPDQFKNMIENYKTSGTILEIHDNSPLTDDYFTEHQFKSFLATISIECQSTIYWSTSMDETIEYMLKIWKRTQDHHERSPINKSKRPQDPLQSQQYFLSGLVGVGLEKTIDLLNHFQTPISVIASILETNIIYTKGGKPKGIDGTFSMIKGFGPKFIEENKKLLCEVNLCQNST